MEGEKEDNRITSRYEYKILHMSIAHCKNNYLSKAEFQRDLVLNFFKQLEKSSPGTAEKLLRLYNSMTDEERKHPEK